MKRLLSALALALVTGLALTGCGNDSSTNNTSTTDFNTADVTFTQSMVPHHEQAVVMAKMAASHADSAEVKQLAAEIEAAQGPEIETMTGWLKAWGQKAPADGMTGMDLGSEGMAGMMSDDDLKSLDAAKGASFDTMFLTMMIAHHEGAIEMATAEQSDGKNADATALATKIESDQTAEIAQMKHLLTP